MNPIPFTMQEAGDGAKVDHQLNDQMRRRFIPNSGWVFKGDDPVLELKRACL